MPASTGFSKPRPGDIEIIPYSFILTSGGGEAWDIRHLVREFSLYEALDQDHLRLDLIMEDSLSLIARMPILGEETLSLIFRTPSVTPDQHEYRTIALQMVVVNCQKVQYTNTRTEVFKLEFVSQSCIANAKTVVKDFLEGPISSMVGKIGKDYLGYASGGQDGFTVSPTIGYHKFAIPGLSPFETIHFLGSEAQAPFVGSNYLFFHTNNGAKFTTSEELIGAPVKNRFHDTEGGTYYVTEHSLFQHPVKKKQGEVNTSVADIVSGGIAGVANALAGYTNPAEWRSIFEFTVEQLFDVEGNLGQGLYDNQVTTIDPILQQYENVKTLQGQEYFDYLSHFPAFVNTGGGFDSVADLAGPGGPLISQSSPVAGGSGQSSMRYLVTNVNHAIIPEMLQLPRLRQNFLPYLSSMLGQLNSVVAHITVPGDSNRRVGDNIIFDLHEIGATEDIMGELHEYLSGKWLVAACRHKYTYDTGYVTIMKCIKNAFDTPIHTTKPTRAPNRFNDFNYLGVIPGDVIPGTGGFNF